MNQILLSKMKLLHRSIGLPREELDIATGCGYCRVESLENDDFWEMYTSEEMEEDLAAYFTLLKEVFQQEDFSIRFSYFYYAFCLFMVSGMHMFEIPEKLLPPVDPLEKINTEEKRKQEAVPFKCMEQLFAVIFGLPYAEDKPVLYSDDIAVKTDPLLIYNSINEYDRFMKALCEDIGHPEEFPLYQEFLRSILHSFLFEEESDSLMTAIKEHLPSLYTTIELQREDQIWQQVQFEHQEQREDVRAWNDFVPKKPKDESFSQYIQRLYGTLLNMDEKNLVLTCGFSFGSQIPCESESSRPLYQHFFNSKHLKAVAVLCDQNRKHCEKSEKLYQLINARLDSPLSPKYVKHNQWRLCAISKRILSLCQERFYVYETDCFI